MSRIMLLGIAILAALAIMLPKHSHQWYQPQHGAYSYSVVECGHNDLCLGA